MENNTKITIAIPKGKLGYETLSLLNDTGLPVSGVKTDSRKLMFEFPQDGITYLICRPTDIPTYVEYGAADLGIVGKDSLVESAADVFELVDLNFGRCKLVVALPANKGINFHMQDYNNKRVATKFPRVANEYFGSIGMQVEVIKLHGNVELAPATGLAEMIVDIVSTGNTLKANELLPVADIFESTARLIANRVSYRLKSQRIQPLVNKFRKLVEETSK